MFHVLHALGDELDHIFPLIVKVVTIDKVQEGYKLVAILCHGERAGSHDAREDAMEAASAPPDELYDVVGQTEMGDSRVQRNLPTPMRRSRHSDAC
jgi:hypothetical protein